MMRLPVFCFVVLATLLSCKSTTYFVVRHAEKEGGSSSMLADPPLSAEGEKQALDLKAYLQGKNIKAVYSTNYARTIATAEPTRQLYGVNLKKYDPGKQDELLFEVKKISDGNVLIVGHSNTIDDVVNGLIGEKKEGDLPDSEYGTIFIVKRKGNSYSYERTKLPKTTPR